MSYGDQWGTDILEEPRKPVDRDALRAHPELSPLTAWWLDILEEHEPKEEP